MFRKLILVGGLAITTVGASLIHPFASNGVPGNRSTILNGAHVDAQTSAILKRACQNCHSNETEWPWYGHVAPVSWLLEHDVQQARLHLNLSQWQYYSTEERRLLLSEIGSAVRNRQMPVQRYLLLHPEARLTELERQQIYHWTRAERAHEAEGSAMQLRITVD